MVINQIFKSLLFLLAIITFSISNVTATPILAPQNTVQPLDQIVAIVNNDIITQSQLNAAIIRVKKQIRGAHASMPDETTLKNGVLNQLIYKRLQLQIAKNLNVKVSNEQIDNAIQRLAQQRHLNLAQLKQNMLAESYNYSAFRKELGEEIAISQVQQQAVASHVTVTNEDIDNYLKKYIQWQERAKQYHVGDVRIALPASPSQTQLQAAQAKVKAIINQLKRNKQINKIIAHYADVDYTDLGWRPITDLPNLFTSIVPQMKINAIAGPITAPNGYHILKLLGTRGKANKTPTRTQIQQFLFQQKFQKALQDWLLNLRKNAYVKILIS